MDHQGVNGEHLGCPGTSHRVTMFFGLKSH